MVLPFRSKVSLEAGEGREDFHQLCERYGALIGHQYGGLADADAGHVRRVSNISLPEACATGFNRGLSRFTLSDNRNGLDLVMLSMAGPGSVLVYEQKGRTVRADNGGVIVHSTTEPLVSRTVEVGPVLAIALPRRKLSALLLNDDLTRMRALDPMDPAVILLRSQTEALLTLQRDPDFAVAEVIGDQLCDLAALAIGANGRGRDRAMGGEALADARYRQALTFLRRNLHRPDLDDVMVARHLRLSISATRQLFCRKGLPVARQIRALRLERAYQMLCHDRARERTVVEIALDCGFASLSTFYRTFQEAYGIPPSHLREDGAAAAPPPVRNETRL